MKLNELAPAEGSKANRNRVGRGIGSGNGKTSGKGHKGQKARSGGGVRPGFEGGQMPLTRRIPKRGFKNIFRTEYLEVKISDLEKFENDVIIDLETLKLAGIAKGKAKKLAVLGNGELTKKLIVKANKFTKTAESKITAVGGKAEVI